MASASATLTSNSFCPKPFHTTTTSSSPTPSTVFFNRASKSLNQRRTHHPLTIKAMTLDFSGSFFEGGMNEDDILLSTAGGATSTPVAEEKEEPQCPPGLRQYETMMVLRPDMSEDERLTLIQKYEELIIAGGGMYVEVFNRGVIPLAYSIKKRNRAGETNTYFDGIFLLFTYFTKPESVTDLEKRLNTDDNVIRSTNFKIRKRKYN